MSIVLFRHNLVNIPEITDRYITFSWKRFQIAAITCRTNEISLAICFCVQICLLVRYIACAIAKVDDCEPLLCFAQQVNGYGKAGDVFLGISTSGNSKNILYAATTAHAKGMKVIGLTGAKDSKLTQMSDVCIKVPQTETYMIQELHLPVYHCLCLMLEDEFFGEN